MGFDSGSSSLRMFYVKGELPESHVSRFATNALPPIDSLGAGEISGWVTSRHMLDRNITDEHAHISGYLRLCLVKAERKIPGPLLRAECKMEELAEMQARDLTFLKRPERAEIKKAVTNRLLPQMPPTLTGIDIGMQPGADVLFANALAEKQVEALIVHFRNATGCDLIPVTPLTLGARALNMDVRDVIGADFSPEPDDSRALQHVGYEFLTWLWFFCECRGGVLPMTSGEAAVMIEGPLLFVNEGDGAHETALRKGNPEVSSEAKSALTSGKKLRRAKVTFVRGEEALSMMLDADEFICRSVKFPKSENLDAYSRFQDRMLAMHSMYEVISEFYTTFLRDRVSDHWDETLNDIRQWVRDRRERR